MKRNKSNFIPVVVNMIVIFFSKKLIDMEKDEAKLDNIPETNKEDISTRKGCIQLIDRCYFLMSRLGSFVFSLGEKNHKTIKIFSIKEIIGDDNLLNIVSEIDTLISRVRYDNESIWEKKKDFTDENEKLEEALKNFVSEKCLENLRREIPDEQGFLKKKLAYTYKLFNSINDYQEQGNYFKNEDLFSQLKTNCPFDEEIERTIKIFKNFNIKNGKKMKIYLRSDFIILTSVFEKFQKVSITEFAIILFYTVSLPGLTMQCGLKYTDITLQTLQEKELILKTEKKLTEVYLIWRLRW